MGNLLRRLLSRAEGPPGPLLTGMVGPDRKGGGWSVDWVGDGTCPPRILVPTLSEAVDQATSAAAALYAGYPLIEEAELQLAVYPWAYKSGPMFDITGQPGAFTARDVQGSDQSVSGATLEDLVAAARPVDGRPAESSMFRWVRRVDTLPVPPAMP